MVDRFQECYHGLYWHQTTLPKDILSEWSLHEAGTCCVEALLATTKKDLSEAKTLMGHAKLEAMEGKKIDYSVPAEQAESMKRTIGFSKMMGSDI